MEDEQGYGRNDEKRNGEGEVGLSPPLIVQLDNVLFTEHSWLHFESFTRCSNRVAFVPVTSNMITSN